MNARYRFELSQTERSELTALLSGGKQAARKLKRAQILLAADVGFSDDDIATSVGAKRRAQERAVSSRAKRCDGLFQATGGPRPLDPGTIGGSPPLELLAAHRPWQSLPRDRAPAFGRKRPQALAQGHVVYSTGLLLIGWEHSWTIESIRLLTDAGVARRTRRRALAIASLPPHSEY